MRRQKHRHLSHILHKLLSSTSTNTIQDSCAHPSLSARCGPHLLTDLLTPHTSSRTRPTTPKQWVTVQLPVCGSPSRNSTMAKMKVLSKNRTVALYQAVNSDSTEGKRLGVSKLTVGVIIRKQKTYKTLYLEFYSRSQPSVTSCDFSDILSQLKMLL